MLYISKGIPLWRPAGEAVSVSHCGKLHQLDGIQGRLWLDGQYQPARIQTPDQMIELERLSGLGIVSCSDGEEGVTLFRLLVNCAICPFHAKHSFTLLSPSERRLLRWIRRAGLRLTIAELTLLAERGVKPAPALLGEENRQTLTETIYSPETIGDNILESLMEHSPAQADTVRAVFGLLRKKKIFLL